MDTGTAALLSLMVVLEIVIIGLLISNGHSSPSISKSGALPTTTASAFASTTIGTTTIESRNATLYSNTPYYGASAEIYPTKNLSYGGQIAVSNFNQYNKTLQNGSAQVQLAFNSGATYNITAGPGDKLYFIDGSLGDDSPGGDNGYTGEDGYALVDPSGYVITIVYPLANA